MMSRKSLRIWPIEGNDEEEMRAAYSKFARHALRIPEKEELAIKVDRIR